MAQGPGSIRNSGCERAVGLHGYFVAEHNISDHQLLAYRREVSKVDPSLPQRAGQALTKWRMKEARWRYVESTHTVPRLARSAAETTP